jgi:hypothetical protein
MDIHLHIVSIAQVWDCIMQNKGAIVVAWLVIIKILTAIQDAIDVMPSGLKPPFGRIIYLMKATIPYLGWGNRIKPISDVPVTTSTAIASAAKVLPLLFLFLLIGSSSWAKTTVTNTTINNTEIINPEVTVITEKVEAGPMADAPYLVKITNNWYLGFEGGKDEVYTNTSKGWFGYAKATYTGTLLCFSHCGN